MCLGGAAKQGGFAGLRLRLDFLRSTSKAGLVRELGLAFPVLLSPVPCIRHGQHLCCNSKVEDRIPEDITVRQETSQCTTNPVLR